MANDKQWTDEELELWANKMYREPLARAQAAQFQKEFERWHTGHLLNSLTHHFTPHHEKPVQTT